MEVNMSHKTRIIALCIAAFAILPLMAMGRRAGRGSRMARNNPHRAAHPRVSTSDFSQDDMERAIAASLLDTTPQADIAAHAGDEIDDDIPAELLAESVRMAEENAKDLEEKARQAELANQRQQEERGPRIPITPAPNHDDDVTDTPVAHDHIDTLLQAQAERLRTVLAETPKQLSAADEAKIHQAQLELEKLQNQLGQKDVLSDDDLKQIEQLQQIANTNWLINPQFGFHYPVEGLTLNAIQLRSAPQGPRDCGLFSLANNGALVSALQSIGMDGINSEAIASLVTPVVARCHALPLVPQQDEEFANFDGLDAAVHALHSPDYLPIAKGYATIGIEQQHDALVPGYAAVWAESNQSPRVYHAQDFVPEETEGEVDPVAVALPLIEQSLRQSGTVGFIINPGQEHWVAASVVTQPGQEPLMVYFNSTNAPADEHVRPALEYVCQLCHPALQVLDRVH